MGAQEFNRKLTAILHADVAGYSRLSGEDEEGTHRRLSACREQIAAAIERHGGRVVHWAGDAVLADFATASTALTSAADIQQELGSRNQELPERQQIQFRIGINLGEVIVDRNDIFGDGVNIAARLQGLAEPGGVCISESVRMAVGSKLPFAYEFLGEQSLKNIAEPVRAYRVLLEGRRAVERPAAPRVGKPSIAVLPFENMSGDPEQEYFADGVTEEIITTLSRIRWFFVIARNSTFSYKGRAVDVRQVAKDLGVRYVVQGSVRRAGSRVRVAAQLIDGATGTQVWANRYERAFDDVFAMQDELTQSIVGALEPELGKAERERARAKRPEHVDAWDLYQQGLWHLYHYTKEDLEEAREFFRRAIALDPGLGAAFAALAESYYFSVVYGHSSTPKEDRSAALLAARTAVELDPEDAAARGTLGRIHYLKREHDTAIRELETALELNPSLAWAHYGTGAALVFSGRAQEAFPHLRAAIQLSPRDPNLGSFLVRMAEANLFVRDYEEAIEWGWKALRQPGFQWSRYAVLVCALAHLDRLEEANRVLAELVVRRPDFSLDFAQRGHLIADAEYMAHYLAGLRKAGVN